jgi:hypothetical protein
MTEWAYKTTGKKASFDDTKDLADTYLFLCRSAFTRAEPPARAANVRHVRVGDGIHVYFMEQTKRGLIANPLGRFEVVEASAHPHAADFGEQVRETALWKVRQGRLLARLRALKKYAHDPVEDAYTGWLLQRRGEQRAFDANVFPGMATLRALG